MDVRGLLKDKRVLIGGAVAVAAGAFVLFKRKHDTGSYDSNATESSGRSGGVVSPATMDTTGTDIASWLGNYSGSLQNILTEYGKNLTDALGGLQQIPAGSESPVIPTPVPKPKPVPGKHLPNKNPGPKKPPAPKPKKPAPKSFAAAPVHITAKPKPKPKPKPGSKTVKTAVTAAMKGASQGFNQKIATATAHNGPAHPGF
jgi:outer membrane biosynthesis protein TonB